jgi:hypothetical protein
MTSNHQVVSRMDRPLAVQTRITTGFYLYTENIMRQVLNISIAVASCAIAAAITIATPMSAGGTPAATPTSESRAMLDRHVVLAHARRPEPFMQRPAKPVIALVGEGWG